MAIPGHVITKSNLPVIMPIVAALGSFTDLPHFCVRVLLFRNSFGIGIQSDRFRISAQALSDFASVNPNTGTVHPFFAPARDAALMTAIYRRLPVLVDRSDGDEVKAWPVRYATMFHMSNDSHLFRTREELEDEEGAYPLGGNRFNSPSGEWVPLYEGKMVQAYDHRAADVVSKDANLFRPGQQESIPVAEKENFSRLPNPRYYVRDDAERGNGTTLG